MYPLPILPVGVGEKASEDLGIEIAFAFEIAIEAASSNLARGAKFSFFNRLQTFLVDKQLRSHCAVGRRRDKIRQ